VSSGKHKPASAEGESFQGGINDGESTKQPHLFYAEQL